MTGIVHGPAWPMETAMRILTNTALYEGDYGSPTKTGHVSPKYTAVMDKAVALLRKKIESAPWMEQFVEFVELKFEKSRNIGHTWIEIKSVVNVEDRVLGKIKKEHREPLFGILYELSDSISDAIAEKVAAKIFWSITDVLWSIKSACLSLGENIRLDGAPEPLEPRRF